MQKFIDFIEKHVQWVALGLGGIYFLFITYSYLLTDPVTVEVGDEMMTPGDVDEFIANEPAKRLADAMLMNRPVEMLVPEFTETFQKKMAWANTPIAMLTPPWLSSQTTSIQESIEVNPGNPDHKAPVKELPSLDKAGAKPELVGTSFGRSVVELPPPLVQPAVPGQIIVPGQEEAAGLLPPTLADRDWVSYSFKVQMSKVAGEFKRVNVPDRVSTTLFLQVELIRQQLQPDGTWGEEKVVPYLAIHQIPPFPGNGKVVQSNFMNQWAVSHQEELLHPAFYTVHGGDPWTQPAPPAPPVVIPPPVINRPFDPRNPDAEPEDEEIVPDPNALPVLLPPPPAPVGQFNPAVVVDMEVWAHDDTVQPEKTYRYKLRYKLKNPVFALSTVADPRELADVFFLQSPDSEWTTPITIPARTQFFIASVHPDGSGARFDIFVWKSGGWQKQSFTRSPGDIIGGAEWGINGMIDFSTGWSLVDIRSEGRRTEVLLVNEDGHLLQRDIETDRNNPEKAKLEELVRQNQVAAR